MIFGGLRWNESIQEIDLSNNSIGDKACDVIALVIKEKFEFDKLIINLTRNQISNEGYCKIKEALKIHNERKLKGN